MWGALAQDTWRTCLQSSTLHVASRLAKEHSISHSLCCRLTPSTLIHHRRAADGGDVGGAHA